MTFNPHTDADRRKMLDRIGIETVAELFDAVPANIRFPELNLPPVLSEMEAAARMTELAAMNMAVPANRTFLGAGSYRHYTPAAVGQILARGEIYTAYTPYQPEVSQGTLQIIYEFQSLVADLFEMEVANASMYDGATALAEAVLMAVATGKKRSKVIVAGSINPRYRAVIGTYTVGLPIKVIDAPLAAGTFGSCPGDFRNLVDDGVAAIVVQYPNFFGGIEDLAAYAEMAHDAGALLVVSTYPVALSLLKTPGAFGADIVTAEGQSLGVAQSFGGPYVGLIAARNSFVRQMPGRLVGRAYDSEGKRGFVLALQTREQHIRREKATSNICTNQGLMATAATVYMATVGPEGFREVGRRAYDNAHYLAARIAELDGFSVPMSLPFFSEFVIRTPGNVAELNRKLAAVGVVGGFDLGTLHQDYRDYSLIAVTEMHDKASLDEFVVALA